MQPKPKRAESRPTPLAVAAESPSRAGPAEHRAALRGFLLRMVRDEALAEDLVQETFLRAARPGAAFRGKASERSWLFAIALNLCRDHFRAAARRPAPAHDPKTVEDVPSDEDVERSLLSAEMSTCIAEYLFQLSGPQREIVALHDMAGMKHREIASTLGLTEGASRVYLHRGRKALRALLERNCDLSFGDDAVPCERKQGPAAKHRTRMR